MSALKSSAIALIILSTELFSSGAQAAEVSAYYRTKDQYPPSYSLSQKGITTIRINKPNERIRILVVNGMAEKAVVEQWYNDKRVTVSYISKDKGYKISGMYITNLGHFHNAATPLAIPRADCTFKESEIEKISEAISSIDLVDSSCGPIGANKIRLLSLRKYLDPAEGENKLLLQCLADLSRDVNSSNLREQLIDLRASLVAMIKKEAAGTPTIRLRCEENKENDTSTAEADPKTGIITFKYENKKLVDTENLKATFVHELVHQTHPLAVGITYEEKLADLIANKCAGGKLSEPEKVAQAQIELEGAAQDTSRSIVLDSNIKGEALVLSQAAEVKIQSAVAAIPPQSVNQQSIAAMEQISNSTNPTNANSVNAAFESVTDAPTQAFSSATTKVAAALVPSAHAASASSSPTNITISQTLGGGSGSASTASSPASGSTDSRRPASSEPISRYNGPTGSKSSNYDPNMENAQASSAQGPSILAGATNLRTLAAGVNNQEKIVEEIIVPNAAGTGFTRRVIETQNVLPSQSIAATNARNEQAVSMQVTANLGGTVSPGTESNPLISGGGGSGSGSRSRAPASRGTASVTLNSSRAPNIAAVEVNGVSFAHSNIDGVGYQRYKSQINSSQFKTSLEAAGILITRSGSLLSKPKTVSATYIDNGNALIYGGL